jgi:acyl-CoA synthetase (AMP-forming)/AMP-acid ligase II
VLAAFAGVQQAAAFAVPNAAGIDELAVAVVAASFDADALGRHCGRELPAALVPTRFIQVTDIPRNEMGKIDRRRLVELFLKA